jgi:hypothetical protein
MHVSHAAKEEIMTSARADEDLVLQDIKNGATSFTDIARARGWYTPKNEPNRSKAQRIVNRLKRAKLVVVDRGRHVLTDKGKKATQ